MMLVDGRVSESISLSDRGFQYGDGCFTTLEVRNGVPLLLARHLSRLQHDAARLDIPFDGVALLRSEAIALAATVRDGVLKMFVTRGSGGRGYRYPDPIQPSRILSLHPLPVYPRDWPSSGVALHVCQTRLGVNPRLAGLKHMNRLEQVLARNEWHNADVAEGLMLDAQGYVVEGTMSNVFMLRNNCLETPKLDRCGVRGVMRTVIVELAAELGVAVEERRCRLAQLLRADEVFLSNSLIGIWPVRRLLDRNWTPGPCTRRLIEAVARYKQQASERYGEGN